jgi:serine/threonine-protein kinase
MATEQLFADRYKLDRRLGVGGMATVQLAFDTRLERYVAVKLLAEHLAEDSSFVSRFRREALAAARLVHPNIVQVFDFGLDEATARNYIVMEFVDGESCAEILRDHGPMATRDAVNVLSQACRGLDYAHRNGVVHRDVKPGNLLRSRDNAVKLADFGIAKAAAAPALTGEDLVLGTAAYLAPEQAQGGPVDARSDVYALGCVLYELLTGAPPFGSAVDSTSLAVALRHLNQQPEPPSRRNPQVDAGMDALVLTAMAKRPEQRHQSAEAMGRELARVVAQHAARAAPVWADAPTGPLPRLPARRGSAARRPGLASLARLAGMTVALVAALLADGGTPAARKAGHVPQREETSG